MADASRSDSAVDADDTLFCRVGGQTCAIPLEHVIETMRPLPIERFGGAPSCVLGLARIRGAHIPVVDLGRLLDLPMTATSTRFVLLRYATGTIALLVESVTGVHKLASGERARLPPLLETTTEGPVAALAERDRELVLLLQAARLVPDGLDAALAVGNPS